jgi:light-independent protochlorophyllide reductase subunit B
MGIEGANVMFDAWVHPLMMGLEEHLLHMFRDDFEFHAEASPSHLGSAGTPRAAEVPAPVAEAPSVNTPQPQPAASGPIVVAWAPDAEQELRKIPFFVRGKARRNTERYASDRGVATITVETLYDAKAHFSA